MSRNMEHMSLPDLNELRQFHEGGLDPARMEEIRTMAQDSPLLRESMEGYAEAGAFDAMPAFDQTPLAGFDAAASSTATQTAASLTQSAVQTTFWTITTTKLIVGFMILTGVGICIYWDKQHNQSKTSATTTAQQSADAGQENLAALHQTDTLKTSNTNSIVPALPAAGEEATLTQTEPESAALTPLRDRSEFPPNEIVSKESKLHEHANAGDDGIRESKKGLIMVGMTQVLHYRVADYTEVRKEKWSNAVFSEGHTPANQESKGAMPKEMEQNALRYLEYIESCITYLDRKQYKQAREGFDALLKLYPDDVNAQFYGAMARYRSGEYAGAVPLFKLTESNAMRVFREDAKFYRAMSLKASNNPAEAKVLFEEIATAGGAYAKRALEENQ